MERSFNHALKGGLYLFSEKRIYLKKYTKKHLALMFGRIFVYKIAEKLLIYKGKNINYQSKYKFWLGKKCNSLLLKVKWSVLDQCHCLCQISMLQPDFLDFPHL